MNISISKCFFCFGQLFFTLHCIYFFTFYVHFTVMFVKLLVVCAQYQVQLYRGILLRYFFEPVSSVLY